MKALQVSKIGMTAQNRVWFATCVLYRALIEGNEADAKAAHVAILDEFKVSKTVEGIQDDWSFHQHGNQAQFGNYGASYISTMTQLVAMFNGTPWAVPDEKRHVLEKLVSNGYMPIVWRFSEAGVDVSVTGISSEKDKPVVTTVEQSIAQPGAKWWREKDGIVAVNGAICYELPSNAVVRVVERTGSWKDCMEELSDEKVSGRVFEIVIPHGRRPSGASCSWRVSCPRMVPIPSWPDATGTRPN